MQIGDKIANRYEIFKILSGGMGIVYICYDHKFDMPIALKTYHESLFFSEKAKKVFDREALIWTELEKYPFIVRAYWLEKLEGRLFLALEYVAPDTYGRNTLSHYLNCPLSLDKIVKISLQFCYGIKYAYSKGIDAHRDIKPDNIMITANKTVKITDFGLAKAFSEIQLEGDFIPSEKKHSLSIFQSKEQRICGTLPYMAPEQFDGRADIKSDIYSYGIVLFQMATEGRLPFVGKDFPEFEALHRQKKVPAIFHPLLPIIQKCLRKDPWERYQNFTMLKEDLRKMYRRKTGKKFKPPRIKKLEPWELYNKGISLFTLGKFKEANSCFDNILKIEPHDIEALLYKGIVFGELNKYDDAINCFDEIIAINPKMVEALYCKGTTLNRLEKHNEAIECFNKALEIDPRNASVWYNMGNSYYRLKVFDKALHCYDKAVENNPQHINAWIQKGFSYGSLEQVDEAIQCFEDAIKLDPKNAKAWFSKALAEDEIGRTNDAAQSFRNFVMLEPEGYKDELEHAYQRLKELK